MVQLGMLKAYKLADNCFYELCYPQQHMSVPPVFCINSDWDVGYWSQLKEIVEELLPAWTTSTSLWWSTLCKLFILPIEALHYGSNLPSLPQWKLPKALGSYCIQFLAIQF